MAISPVFEKLFHAGSRRVEVDLDVANHNRTYEITTVSMRDNRNRLAGWLGMLHDITERKEAERSLAAALEKERELRLSLEKEINKRLRFSRALVHELKTPLTPIIATGGLLSDELKDEPWNSMARNMHRGAENLNRRVDELLDFARGEMGVLEVSFAVISPLKTLMEAAAEAMMAMDTGRRPYFRVNLPENLPSVKADEVRVKQILRYLIDNACKFTRRQETIELRARQDNNSIVVEIQDEGPGLTEAEQAKLFYPYERAEVDHQLLSGLGLGLALSKMLVELHGGTIWVESHKDQGSTFAFSLPVVETMESNG